MGSQRVRHNCSDLARTHIFILKGLLRRMTLYEVGKMKNTDMVAKAPFLKVQINKLNIEGNQNIILS